jgi:7-cyano-7-deazaguanine synthase
MAPKSRPRAVVLLSGGLDSTTTLAVAQAEGYEVYALTVEYGQRHAVELEAASRVAEALGVAEHSVLHVDLARFGGSALTTAEPVPKDRPADARGRDVPVTYVPARNTVLLALALAWAETLGTGDIFIGVNALDYSGYPDCRPEYVEAFERMANLATKAATEGATPVSIHAPLIGLTKKEIIGRGVQLGVDCVWTV